MRIKYLAPHRVLELLILGSIVMGPFRPSGRRLVPVPVLSPAGGGLTWYCG